MSAPPFPLIFGPNITGNVNVANGWGSIADAGALYREGTTQAPGGGAANGTYVYLVASRSSSVFGSSSTVQPPSMALLACIKT